MNDLVQASLPSESLNEVRSILTAMTREGIRYVVIRRSPESEWTIGGDIDLLVDPADTRRARRLLSSRGLVPVATRVTGTGIFFRKITLVGLITIHVQHRIFYHNSHTTYLDGLATLVLDSAVVLQEVRYAAPEINRYLVIGKLKYEDAPVSAKYQDILGDTDPPRSTPQLVAEFDAFMRERGISERRVQRVNRGSISRALRIGTRLLKNILNNQHVCVQGVDGTGKTTLAQRIRHAFGDRAALAYMGEKEWATPLARRVVGGSAGPASTGRRSLMPLAMYLDMWSRWLSVSARSGVVVFDRYPSELYIRKRGIPRLIYWVLFRVLFPRPRHRYYLTCNLATSASRKTDVRDPAVLERLTDRKQQFDRSLGRQRGVVVLDTERLGQDEALARVIATLSDRLVARL